MGRYGLHVRLARGLRRSVLLADTPNGSRDELENIYILFEDENFGSETDEELRKGKDKLTWHIPTTS